MTHAPLTIGISGRGALFGMFLSEAQKSLPHAVFYDRSARFLAARKRELELGRQGTIDPRTAVRPIPLAQPFLRVHFEQTLFSDTDIKTTVTVIHMPSLHQKTLALSAQADRMNTTNVEQVFQSQCQRIVAAIRHLAGRRKNPRASALSPGSRPVAAVSTGAGRSVGRNRGPHGLAQV